MNIKFVFIAHALSRYGKEICLAIRFSGRGRSYSTWVVRKDRENHARAQLQKVVGLLPGWRTLIRLRLLESIAEVTVSHARQPFQDRRILSAISQIFYAWWMHRVDCMLNFDRSLRLPFEKTMAKLIRAWRIYRPCHQLGSLDVRGTTRYAAIFLWIEWAGSILRVSCVTPNRVVIQSCSTFHSKKAINDLMINRGGWKRTKKLHLLWPTFRPNKRPGPWWSSTAESIWVQEIVRYLCSTNNYRPWSSKNCRRCYPKICRYYESEKIFDWVHQPGPSPLVPAHAAASVLLLELADKVRETGPQPAKRAAA